MDATSGFQPEAYLTWKVFSLPGESGSKTAVAMSNRSAGVFIALYTLLITAIFILAWNVLIAITILFLTPKKMTRTIYIAITATWSSTEPINACILILRHATKVFYGAVRQSHPIELTWEAFWFDIPILVIALGTFGGSVAVGLLFPDMLVIGSVAPVNLKNVYLPVADPYSLGVDTKNKTKVSTSELCALEYERMGASRAIAVVDRTDHDVRKQYMSEKGIFVRSSSVAPYKDEIRYEITYNYTVHGHEMGLQHLGDLAIHVSGKCQFCDDWYQEWVSIPMGESIIEFESYKIWQDVDDYPNLNSSNRKIVYIPISSWEASSLVWSSTAYASSKLNQATGVSYYVILPASTKRAGSSPSRDPWYTTKRTTDAILGELWPYEIKQGRPPLRCEQRDRWSYGKWDGTLDELMSPSEGPGVDIPPGIEAIVRWNFAIPMVFRTGRSLKANALESCVQPFPPIVADGIRYMSKGFDTRNARAVVDIQRLVLGAYLATRDVFRTSALQSHYLRRNADFNLNPTNSLFQPDGTHLKGSGDFVVFSNSVKALRLKYLLLVPSILTFFSLITGLLKASRQIKICENGTGRLDRYLMLVTGLRLTQLYRMVDQLLADRAPPDSALHSQALWKGQMGSLPFVVNNPGAQGEVVLPDLQVQQPIVEGSDRRLILDIPQREKATSEETGYINRWRPLESGRQRVRLSAMIRQPDLEGLELEREAQGQRTTWRNTGVPGDLADQATQGSDTTLIDGQSRMEEDQVQDGQGLLSNLVPVNLDA